MLTLIALLAVATTPVDTMVDVGGHRLHFVIHRGTVDLPDDVGDSLGWVRLDDDGQSPIPRNVPEARGEVQDKRSQGA